MNLFRVLLAPSALLLITATSAAAQGRVAKLDPLLRPFRNVTNVTRANAAARVEDVPAAIALPGTRQIVLTRAPGQFETMVDVFISLTDPDPGLIEAAGGDVRVFAGTLFGARVPLSALSVLEADPRVRFVRAAHYVRVNNDLAMADIRANLVRTRVGTAFTGSTGTGVIVGIFDTGIDFSHADFKNADGTTRILFLWDQTITGTTPGTIGGQAFSRGNECTAATINAGTCSERDTFGHGTHVSGIATGNGGGSGTFAGVAPNADIIVVKGGNGSFSSLNIVEGIQYIFKRATALGRPAVVNLSLGFQFSSHDGTDPEELAIDSLSGPGRIVVIAAGNDGSNQNNVGPGSNAPFLIHAARTMNTADTAQFTVTVPAYTPAAGAGNDFSVITMWYDARDTVTITVTRPNATTFSARTGDVGAANDDAQGRIFLDNASAGLDPLNGDRQAEIEFFDASAAQTTAAGTWRITITMNRRLGNGRFDCWEYASSYGSGILLAESPLGSGGDNGFIVGSPGNASRAITVAAHATRTSWASQGGSGITYTVVPRVGDLATFSSSGPSRAIRDNPSRQKPDISAPGFTIFSSLSANTTPAPDTRLVGTDGTHVIDQGTSMSSPMVTGAVALLLERNPILTPEQARTILTGAARSDAFTGVAYNTANGGSVAAPLPNASWGAGKLDVPNALAATPSNLLAAEGPQDRQLGGRFVLPAAIIPSIQIRVTGSLTDALTFTGIRLRSTGTGNDLTAVTGVSLYADVDSSGTVGVTDVLLGTVTVSADEGEAVFTGLTLNIPVNGRVYLLGTYALNSTPLNAQTFQLNFEAAANLAAKKVSDGSAVAFAAITVAGSVVRAQGVGTLAIGLGGTPLSGGLVVGTRPALQLVTTAGAPEDVRLDSIRVAAASGAPLAGLVTQLAIYLDASGNGTATGTPLATVTNPFASGGAVTLGGLNQLIAATAAKTFVITVTLGNALRQGDTLGLSAVAGYGTGQITLRQAVVTAAGASTLSAANLLAPGEAFIVSENPVRSGQVIFSYATAPVSVSLYNFAGLRVRRFTQLPPDRYVWDVRAESPGLPNGMYLVVIETGAATIRQRLMILSPR